MKTQKANLGGRLDMGAAILAAAQVVDVELIKPRLGAFASAQRGYAEAQRQVQTAETRLRDAQVRLALRDAEQDQAVENVARVLVADGQPRTNPFVALGIPAPSIVKQMPCAAEAKAIHQLVAAVQRNKAMRKTTLQAAQAAEQAAQRVDAALLVMDKLQDTLRNARYTRDPFARLLTQHIAMSWF